MIYECILLKDLYIIIHTENDVYKRFMLINYKKRINYIINNINTNIKKLTFRITNDCNCIVIYNDLSKLFSTYFFLNDEKKYKKLVWNLSAQDDNNI